MVRLRKTGDQADLEIAGTMAANRLKVPQTEDELQENIEYV